MAALLALASGLSLTPPAMAGPADGIVIDGRTQTGVKTVGNTVNVTTATVTGSNAFNSFSAFNVPAGATANLFLPGGTVNLINLVRDARTDIYGVLNAVKDGRIGGNVWFANPYGMVVGAGGVVNVGSLTVATPTAAFVDKFFRAPGTPDEGSVSQLLSGNAPRNAAGQISIHGRINAINGVTLSAGAINVSGSIYSGARFIGSAPDFSDVVNVNGLAPATRVVTEAGRIRIVADTDVLVSGQLVAGGSAGVRGGDVTVTAGDKVVLASGAVIDVSGKDQNSAGGTVYVYGEHASLLTGARIDASAGSSGDGGAIEFSAKQDVLLAGGTFRAGATSGRAGSVLIDPVDLVITANMTTNDGTSIALLADNSITLDAGVLVSSRRIGAATSHLNAASVGHSGNISVTAPKLVLKQGSQVLAHVEQSSIYQAGDVSLTALRTAGGAAEILLDGATVTGRDVKLSASSILTDSSVLVSSGVNQAVASADISLQSSQLRASQVVSTSSHSTRREVSQVSRASDSASA